MGINEIILTVQPYSDGKYRFGINKPDSDKYFKDRGVPVNVILDDEIIPTKTSCGVVKGEKRKRRKKAYDLCDEKIHKWIISNQFHDYPPGDPPELIFELTVVGIIELRFIRKKQ